MKTLYFAAIVLTTAFPATAQHLHQPATAEPQTAGTGQAQFAAIAGIVATLRDDPATDWSRVDIDALRAHLVDMDNVTTKARVERSTEGLTVRFAVTGDAGVAGSVQRMVMAHSPMLAQATGWTVKASLLPDGAAMSVGVPQASVVAEATALGFFGLMTIGAHHRQHHLMIAAGRNPH